MTKDLLCLILVFSHAGLSCVTITGWAKGVDYRPGVAITSQPLNHSWNAVYIDGDWQLVDSHWGTRFLQSESNVAENLVYEFDDFYFLTDPEQLAYTHRPQDSDWQLLSEPQSAIQFEDYPLVKSYFFTNDMHLLPNQNHGVVYAKKGKRNYCLVIHLKTLIIENDVSGIIDSCLHSGQHHTTKLKDLALVLVIDFLSQLRL